MANGYALVRLGPGCRFQNTEDASAVIDTYLDVVETHKFIFTTL